MLRPDEYIVHEAHIRLVAYIPALLLLAGLMMPSRVTGLASTQLALTNKRILGRTGMFRRQKLLLALQEVESVHASRGMLGLMFNYGSVTICGNGNRITFRGLANPREIEMLMEEAVEVAVLGRPLNAVDRPGAAAAPPPPQQKESRPAPKVEEPAAPPPAKEAAPPQRKDGPAPDATYKDPDAW